MNISKRKKQGTRAIAVASGKGGVGKTNLSINLSMALAALGNEVTLFDADLGLANVDVLLGLHPLRNLSHVIREECDLKDILITGPGDIRIVPAASGLKMMGHLTDRQHFALIHAFDSLVEQTDVLVIDTAAGVHNDVLSFCAAAQEVMVVVCNEPASVADAYALIKMLHREYQVRRIRVVINMVDSHEEGRALFTRLTRVCDRYLDVVLDRVGIIPRDPRLRSAVKQQQALLSTFPGSPAAEEIRRIAGLVNDWAVPCSSHGRQAFFLERLLQLQTDTAAGMYS